MHTRPILLSLLFLAIGLAFTFIPYGEFVLKSGKIAEADTLYLALLDGQYYVLGVFSPLLFVLASVLIKNTKALGARLWFVVQAFGIGFLTLTSWFIMSFHLFFDEETYYATFYLILAYMTFFGFFSLALAIPFFDRSIKAHEFLQKFSGKKG